MPVSRVEVQGGHGQVPGGAVLGRKGEGRGISRCKIFRNYLKCSLGYIIIFLFGVFLVFFTLFYRRCIEKYPYFIAFSDRYLFLKSNHILLNCFY